MVQWIHLPAIRRASTHSSCHTELAPNQLPRFHCQRPVASKFTRLEPLGLPCLGGNVWGLSQAPSETENDRRTEEVLQVIWDSLPQGPIDKALKEITQRLKACVAARAVAKGAVPSPPRKLSAPRRFWDCRTNSRWPSGGVRNSLSI